MFYYIMISLLIIISMIGCIDYTYEKIYEKIKLLDNYLE